MEMEIEPGQLDMEDPQLHTSLKEPELYQNLRQNFLMDDAHSAKWRTQAKADFDFIAGDQWPEEILPKMKDEGRQPLTFNMCAPFIEAVCGLEIATRHETAFYPKVTEPGDVAASETVAGTSRWMSANCDAEDHQSAAFQSMINCGMGWVESRMDYELEKDGRYIEEQLDAIEMRWDYAAKQKNLMDSRRMWRVRTFTLSEARERFPDADVSDLNCSWAMGYESSDKMKSIEERRLKLENASPSDPASNINIVQVQWRESECYYRVAMPNGEKEFSEKEWANFKKEIRRLAKEAGAKAEMPVHTKAYRRVYKQAFVGDVILEMTPCPDPERFTLQCITGKLHKTKGTWYGLVSLMRDPQMNLNKWISQALHILNATAKGGILAERSAFRDVAEAQRTYSNPQAITFTEDGAIKDQKIMAKPGAGLAGPYVQLLQFAIDAVPRSVGISLEMLGLVDRNQPGVLESQRKNAGMTILQTLFDSLRQFRKTNGRVRITFIQKYLPDNRIIRILGEEGMKAVRFIRDEHMGEYDVEVSDTPSHPNQKELHWVAIMQLMQLPQFAAMVERNPKIAAELMSYSPLPARINNLVRQAMAAPSPEAQQQAQIGQANAQADLAGKQAAVEKDKSSAQLNQATSLLRQVDAAVKAMALQNEQTARMAAMRAFAANQASRPAMFSGDMLALPPGDGGSAVFPTGNEPRSIPELPLNGGASNLSPALNPNPPMAMPNGIPTE